MTMAADERQIYPDVPERLLRKGRAWRLEVTELFDVSPRMRRVVATGPELAEFSCRAGQSLILRLPQGEGEEAASRHYTVRAFDPAARRVAIDFVLHGDSPANRWVRAAAPGDLFVGVGPRGRVVLRENADWHLFCSDETGLPAVLAMLESLADDTTATALALLEIGDEADRLPVPASLDGKVRWLVREPGRQPGTRTTEALHSLDLPAGDGQAYVVGETSQVRAQRQHLLSRGLEKSQVSAEGYWRPGRFGGHDHVDD